MPSSKKPLTPPPNGINLCDNCDRTLKLPSTAAVAAKLSQSNHSPTQIELNSISRLLSDTEASLEECILHADKLRAVLARLEEQRPLLENQRDVCKGFLSSARRIPVEIWSEIFQMTCEEQSIVDFKAAISLSPAFTMTAMHLSQVCTRWRDITEVTPKVWAIITLELSHIMTERHKNRLAKLISHHLSKSNAAPLTVRVGLAPFLASLHQQPMNILLFKSKRFRDLSLRAKDDSWFTPFTPFSPFGCLKGNLPLLESLSIHAHNRELDLADFSNAPKLRHLSIGCSFDPDSVDFLPQLKSIHFIQYEPVLMSYIVDRCPNLAHITLANMRSGVLHDIEITTSDLTSLGFDFNMLGFSPHALELLTLPKLTHFEAYMTKSLIKFPIQQFLELLWRSECSLTSLDIKYILSLNAQDIRDIFEMTPDLERLILYNVSFFPELLPNELLDSLTYKPDEEKHGGADGDDDEEENDAKDEGDAEDDGDVPPAPTFLLSKLTSMDVIIKEPALDAFLTMVESRCRSTVDASSGDVVPLEYVRVGLFDPHNHDMTTEEEWVPRNDPHDDPAFVARVQAIRATGVKLIVYLSAPFFPDSIPQQLLYW